MSFLKRRASLAGVDAHPEDAPVTTRQVKQLYERPPSFTDLLPWVEYHPASRTFLLEDGVSVGALFELTPAGTEARTHGVYDAIARCPADRPDGGHPRRGRGALGGAGLCAG